MDKQRMDILYKQEQNMDSSLIDILDNYKKYSESTVPVITVLCTDNKLRQEMDMLFSARNDVTAKVYGTHDDQAKENEYDALLCDAAVVCTKATAISPKGLSEAVHRLSKVNKPIYVLLFGWEALPKTHEMIKQRAERVNTEFMFAKVVNVKTVHSEPINGLLPYEDAIQALCRHFTEGFQRLHDAQDEALYRYVKAYVEDYYTKSRTEINGVFSKLNECESKVMLKQNYYITKFTFLEVRFQEIIDKINNATEDIGYYDIAEDSSGNTLTDIYKESGSKAQTYAKKYVIEEFQRRIRQLDEKKDNSIRISAEAIVNECVGEMMGISDCVSQLKYISEKDIMALREACSNDEDLSKIPLRYGGFMNIYLDEIIKRIPAKVKEYEYSMNSSIKMRDIGLRTTEFAKRLLKEDSDDPDDFDIKDYYALRNEQSTGENALMLTQFQNDVDGMIRNAQNGIIAMAQDCLNDIKKDIEQTCSDILKKYFEGIYKALVTIIANTENTLSEFKME